jgi:hypothetical protein
VHQHGAAEGKLPTELLSWHCLNQDLQCQPERHLLGLHHCQEVVHS